MENNKEYAIQVRNLTVSYGPKPALLDVSFMIYSGELVGIIGPNGAEIYPDESHAGICEA